LESFKLLEKYLVELGGLNFEWCHESYRSSQISTLSLNSFESWENKKLDLTRKNAQTLTIPASSKADFVAFQFQLSVDGCRWWNAT
jgi:hypothetical protein